MYPQLPRNVRRAAIFNHLALLMWVPAIVILFFTVSFNPAFVFTQPLLVPLVLWLLPFLAQGLSSLIWQTNAPIHPFVDEHGKEAVNAWLSGLVYLAILMLIWMILMVSLCGLPTNSFSGFSWNWTLFGLMLLVGITVAGIVLLLIQAIAVIIAISRAREGRPYRYPRTLRFLQ